MAGVYAQPVQELIDELGRLPGVGPKSAQRIAFHLLKVEKVDALRLAQAIAEAKDRVTFCDRCFNIAEGRVVRSLHRRASRRHRAVRGRGAARHRRGGEDAGVQRPLPRAAGRHQPDRGHRARPAPHPRAPRPHRDGGRGGGHPLHQPQPRGRGHGHVPRAPAQGPRRAGDADRQRPPVGGDLEYADELTLGRALEGRREVGS